MANIRVTPPVTEETRKEPNLASAIPNGSNQPRRTNHRPTNTSGSSFGSLSAWYEMAQQLLPWLDPTLWLAFCSLYFQCNRRHGGVDSCAPILNFRIAPLSGWLYYSWSPRLPATCTQPTYCPCSGQMAWPVSPRGEMRRPGYCACHPGNGIRFGQPSCLPASREVVSLARPDKLVAPTKVVQ